MAKIEKAERSGFTHALAAQFSRKISNAAICGIMLAD
jgi:hypothetical protein